MPFVRRWCLALSAAAGLLVATACSLTSLDELKENAELAADSGTGGGAGQGGGSGNGGSSGSGGGSGCKPDTCASMNAACGEVSDSCDGTLSCGTCSGDEFCG
ncbi:MAG TPA: hypothetical protein PKA88_16800, partial [Polyangiaceae bacterium]|nr:hypothetical protein [Polyangiaceae bacterium]